MFPLMFGLANAGLNIASTFLNAQAETRQQRARAAQMEAQANAARQQAEMQRQKAELDYKAVQGRKREITSKYKQIQAANRVRAGAGSVDMSDGSFLDVALGNADNYAADLGQNKYEAALKLWEGNEQARISEHQASQYDANASYLKRTASNLPLTLLSAGMSGLNGFIGGYTNAGGVFSNIFKSSDDSAKKKQEESIMQAFRKKTEKDWFSY